MSKILPKPTSSQENVLVIDGASYSIDDFSEEAKNQAGSIQRCDQFLEQYEAELAIAKTARSAYSRSVRENLPD
ncbi:hypothetical protein AVO41_01125 [Thiomicrospira sp. WB1]|nr:hypothetical protein AVO41_01125 [Thiomicrospira sp. WB1]